MKTEDIKTFFANTPKNFNMREFRVAIAQVMLEEDKEFETNHNYEAANGHPIDLSEEGINNAKEWLLKAAAVQNMPKGMAAAGYAGVMFDNVIQKHLQENNVIQQLLNAVKQKAGNA